MKNSHINVLRLALAFVLLATAVVAQQKRGAPARRPAPPPPAQPVESATTFENLLADDSYKVYCEIRGVGQLVRSSAFNDLIDPLMKIGGPPKEFNAIKKWLETHGDSISGSRMLVASWPKDPKLPAVLLAIEFASTEEAQKFESELRRFLPTLVPTPPPAPANTPVDNSVPRLQSSVNNPPPYFIKHAGSILMLSDKAFALRDLKPRRAKLLAEDPNFVTARNRFAADQLFVYVDVKAIEREDNERTARMEEERRRAQEEAAKHPIEEQTVEVAARTVLEATAAATPEDLPPPPAETPTATLSAADPAASSTVSTTPDNSGQSSMLMDSLSRSFYQALFGGQTKWPEAVSGALAFEGDTYVVRVLVLGSGESRTLAIPFLPQLISGPEIVSQSSSVVPADTVFFASASLDYLQIYDELLKTFSRMNETARDGQSINVNTAVSPFAEFEKKLGLKIKADILPLFGNEFGFALVTRPPETPAAAATPDNNPAKKNSFEPDPVLAVAVKDKDEVRRLIPKMIEAFGLKGAGLLAQTERKDDTEIVTYAGMLSYAFVGDFLIFSPSVETTKRAVDSYLNGDTLSSSNYFRNANRWQSRQTLAQVYVAPSLAQNYTGTATVNEKTAELLARFGPIEPLTYALSNEGSGPLHELHVPKNLILMMIAGIANDAKEAPLNANEAAAKSELRTLMSAEMGYRATTGDGKFGTLDELIKAGFLSKQPIERYGYEMELTVSGAKFEVVAVPMEYGKSGRLSYFIDDSGMLRGADHGGGPATVSDPPIQ